jgi:hypothetical protein
MVHSEMNPFLSTLRNQTITSHTGAIENGANASLQVFEKQVSNPETGFFFTLATVSSSQW